MTIDEQINILESNAEFERKDGDLQGCLNFRQLAEWLKELKAYRNNLTNQSLSDALVYSENENERLHDRVNELSKELQAHREAWGKAKRTVKAYLMLEEFGSEYQDDIEKLIEGCIPKEGDAE